MVIPAVVTMACYYWHHSRHLTDPSRKYLDNIFEKICHDKNGEFMMIPILFPPLLEEFFEWIYNICASKQYPKRNYSLIGLDENPLAKIQNNFDLLTILENYFDIKIDPKSILFKLFNVDDTDLRNYDEKIGKDNGTTAEKELIDLENNSKSFTDFNEKRKFGNGSNYLPLSDKLTNSFDENSRISRLIAYFGQTELGQVILIRTAVALSIFKLFQKGWQGKILKELHLHQFRLHELRIRKDKNQRYLAELKYFNIRQLKNPMTKIENAAIETLRSSRSKIIQQRSLKAQIPITSNEAEIGRTLFKSSTGSGWTEFNFWKPVIESSVPLESLVVDEPNQEFVEALQYVRGQYVLHDSKNRTEQSMIRDINTESLRHIYLQRLILDFADVFELIDEIENESLDQMRIFEDEIRKHASLRYLLYYIATSLLHRGQIDKNTVHRILSSKAHSQSPLGRLLAATKSRKIDSNEASTELTELAGSRLTDDLAETANKLRQTNEARSMFGIKPIKETLRNRSGSIFWALVARRRDVIKYKVHKKRFKYDMYFDSLSDSLVDQSWRAELIEMLALHPEITTQHIELIKGTRNIFDAQMQLKIILFDLSDAIYDRENWRSLSTPVIRRTHFCTLKLMNNSLDHQDLLILDRIVENCRKSQMKAS